MARFIENIKKGQAYRVLTAQDEINDIDTFDRLSFWTDASDVEFSNHTRLEEVSDTFYYAEGTLHQNATTVTISGNNITDDGLIDIYVPDEFCKLTPDKIERGQSSVTLTFPEREGDDNVDIPVRVVCKSLSDINAQNNNNGG